MGSYRLLWVGLFGCCLTLGNCCQPPLPAFQHVPPAPAAPLLPQAPQVQVQQQFQAPPKSLGLPGIDDSEVLVPVSGVQSGVASSNFAPAVSNSIDQELTPFSQDDPALPKPTFTPYPGYIPPPPAFSANSGSHSAAPRENGLQNVAIDDGEASSRGCPQNPTTFNQLLSCLQILPPAPMGEHALKCSFEQGTKCRFQPTSPAFQMARLPTPAHYRALARMSNRAETNQPQGDFIVLVERAGATKEEFVISTPITCQKGTGILSFDFWVVGNPHATLHVCTQDFHARSCTNEILHGQHSFVTVQVVHPNASVFDVEVMITNLSKPTLLVIDNLDYKAELCENKVREEPAAAAVIEATPSPDVVESFFEEGESEDDNAASVPSRPDGGEGESGPLPPAPQDAAGLEDNGFVPMRDGPPAMSPFDLEIRQSPLTINKLNPCTQMECDFNKDFCGYKNWRNDTDNTHDWNWTSGRVGNPHTGIREKSGDEEAKDGYLFVGTDDDDNSIITYVLESPLLQLNEDAEILFDIYRRSKDITLQVCLNSANNCPMDVPAFRKETDWIEGLRFPIPQNTTKIFLKAIQWRKFKWLAIDNIRIVGPKECS